MVNPQKPSVDQLAVDNVNNVPRFLQALQLHRYVVLDRDNLPRLAPTEAEIRAAARELARERQADQSPPSEPSPSPNPGRDLLLKKFTEALERHHDSLDAGTGCTVCGLSKWR